MAFAAYTSALLVMAVLAWLSIQYNTVAGIVQLTVALSGNGLGGFALVLGILRDDRAEKAEERAAKAEEQTAVARQQAEQFRQRAERAEAERERIQEELRRFRDEQSREMAERIRRLEIAAGFAPPEAADNDATEK